MPLSRVRHCVWSGVPVQAPGALCMYIMRYIPPAMIAAVISQKSIFIMGVVLCRHLALNIETTRKYTEMKISPIIFPTTIFV